MTFIELDSPGEGLSEFWGFSDQKLSTSIEFNIFLVATLELFSLFYFFLVN